MLRKKRYKPDPSWQDRAWRFTDLDREILTLLTRYRYLRGRYIAALLGRKRGTINKALVKLHGVRLIDKPRSQFLGWNSLNDSDIYEINTAGMRRVTDTVPEATNLVRTRSETPTKQFAHAMMICDTLASIEIGVRRAGLGFVTEAEITATSPVPDPLRLPVELSHRFPNGHSEHVKTHARPDAVFGIRYADGRTRLFLLECEHYSPTFRATFKGTSTLKKIVAYRHLRSSKVLQEHLGKKRFTVLVVFPHQPEMIEKEERAGKPLTLISKAEALIMEVVGPNDLFYLKTVPLQEELLMAPSEYPELMFDAPWTVPGMPPRGINEPPAANG